MNRKFEDMKFVKNDVAVCGECGCGEVKEEFYTGVMICEECQIIEGAINYVPYDEYYD